MALTVGNYSCTKMDRLQQPTAAQIEERFFTAPANTAAPVLKVMAALKKQHAIGGFIPSLAVKDGYALWQHSTIERPRAVTVYNRNGETSDPTTTLVFTPIVQQDSNFVNGFFFSKIVGDSVELHLYRANDYDQYPYGAVDSSVVTAEIVALKIMELDHTIFGERKYEMLDTLLFASHPKLSGIKRTIALKPNTTQAGKYSFYMICIEESNCKCISDPSYCTNETHPCMNGACDLCYGCIDVTCTTLALGGGTPGNGNPWPPDPPPPSTGGGGSNPPPGGGNCTGVNNCGILRSLIVQGKVPCGGCGGGPIVVIPPEEPPVTPPTLDTCAIANNLGLKMDTLYLKGKVDSMLGTLPNWQQLKFEKGFPIYKNYILNAGNISITGYQPGAVQGSAGNLNVSIVFSTSTYKKAAGKVHNHTDTGYAAPSAGDIYELILNYTTFDNTNPKLKYEGSFVASFDTTYYAICISNPADALTFNNTKSLYLDTAAWKIGTGLYKIWDEANTHFYNKDTTLPERARDDNAIMKAHATVLTQFNSGITLFKRNSSGKFKPVVIDTKPDPARPGKHLFTEKCL